MHRREFNVLWKKLSVFSCPFLKKIGQEPSVVRGHWVRTLTRLSSLFTQRAHSS